MKRRLWAIILSATIVLASAIVASAGWSTPTTLIVPGFNGSAFTSNYATKTSTSTRGFDSESETMTSSTLTA